MSATEPVSAGPADGDRASAPSPPEPQVRRQLIRFVRGHAELELRIVAALALVGFAGRSSFRQWAADFAASSPYRALALVPVAAVAVAAWRQLCRPYEVPVHDRHVDAITSLAGVAVAFALADQLSPRLRDLASAAQLDALAAPLWLFALLCALFGTRPAWRHRHAISLIVLAWPLPYNLVASLVPAANFGWWMLAVILTVSIGSIIDATVPEGVTCIFVGLAAGLVVAHAQSPLAGPAAVVASLVATTVAIRIAHVSWLHMRERPAEVLARRAGRPVVDLSVWVAPLLVAAAVALSLAPVTPDPQAIQHAPPRSIGVVGAPSCPSLTGWRLTGAVPPASAGSVNQFAELWCRYHETTGTVLMQVRLSASVPTATLVQFPWEANNQTIGTEQPTVAPVALAPGVRGWVLVYEDGLRPLTTVVVTWDWAVAGTHGSQARRVSVIVTDDPLADSPFPTPQAHLAATMARRLQQVLRTNLTRAVRYQVTAKNLPTAISAARAVAAELMAPAPS